VVELMTYWLRGQYSGTIPVRTEEEAKRFCMDS